MPIALPKGTGITVSRRSLPGDYTMSEFQAAPDHYSLGYLISGDRTTVLAARSYTQHKGCMSLLAPLLYHRTFPASNAPYESYLLKFTAEFIAPFVQRFGQPTVDRLFEHNSNYFPENIRLEVEGLLARMLEISNEPPSEMRDFSLQCFLFYLFILLMEKRLPDNTEVVYDETLTPPIFEAVSFMEQHYARQPGIDETAAVAGFSTAYFSRLFKKQLGQSYSSYLRAICLKHVKDQLLNSDLSVTDIALECGYEYPGNLTAQFKAATGMTPLEFRKKNR